jgi:hypothetical protein
MVMFKPCICYINYSYFYKHIQILYYQDKTAVKYVMISHDMVQHVICVCKSDVVDNAQVRYPFGNTLYKFAYVGYSVEHV